MLDEHHSVVVANDHDDRDFGNAHRRRLRRRHRGLRGASPPSLGHLLGQEIPQLEIYRYYS